MIKLDRTNTFNFENAIHGMRNPLESWHKIDSYYDESGKYVLGNNDLTLASKLRNAGSAHRKYLRQIFVSVDITAPIYWWKEFDTYKVGTVANSTSTMHKLASRDLTLQDLSVEKCNLQTLACMKDLIKVFNKIRKEYVETKSKDDWYNLIQMLPSSYNQTRTVTMNYENLINIFYDRKNHKLDEWHTFCDWINTLPYAEELIIGNPKKDSQMLEEENNNLKKEIEQLQNKLQSLEQEIAVIKMEEKSNSNISTNEPITSDKNHIHNKKSNNLNLKIDWENSLEQ